MVQIIPKDTGSASRLSRAALWAAVGLVVLSATAFGTLAVLQGRTQENIDRAADQLRLGRSPQQKELESRILGVQAKLEDFKRLSSTRKTTAPFFAILEQETHPEVRFTSLTLTPQDRRGVLSGEADSFKDLEEQMARVQELVEVTESELTGIALGETGEVTFEVSLGFVESFFTRP